jgi:hypothetical protein
MQVEEKEEVQSNEKLCTSLLFAQHEHSLTGASPQHAR